MANRLRSFARWGYFYVSMFRERERYRVWRMRCRFVSKRRVHQMVELVGGYPIKLHLGCGGYFMEEWVNCDLRPRSKRVLRVDLLRKLPFRDGSIKFVYTEHVLEHFSIDELRVMLKHIFQTMQEGGVFRIAQPNLQTMIEDSLSSTNWINQKARISVTKEKDLPTGTHYLNFIWNAWGHKFNHTFESLKYELELAGFRKVIGCLYRQSDYLELLSLEQRSEEEDPLIIEAVK